MEAVLHIIPLGKGRFRLNDQCGKQLAIVERRQDVYLPALDYLQRYYYQTSTDGITFEGLELIPFFPTRWWLRKFREWMFGTVSRLVSR